MSVRVCGALGRYDRARVERMAAAMDGRLRAVHEDGGSILMLDREPLAWQGARQRGLGWIEGELWQPGPNIADWRGAAREGASGLVLDGRRRLVHSAVNGLAPIYWREEGGATYFASRIDPLVRTAPSRLSIDWDAWAAIVVLRYPLGERTPFAEVRRLPQFATLRRRLGRSRVEPHAWPWAEVEPDADLATTAEGVAAGIERALAPLPGGIACPLSGGRDSRMLLFALARDGRAGTALTVADDEGDTHEEELAAAVAAALGVPHERLAGAAADYPDEWEERARLVEYQFADHAWLVPLSRRLRGVVEPVPDGFGLDVFFASGQHFFKLETLDIRNGARAGEALFGALRRFGQGERALAADLRGRVEARSQEQFRDATRQFEGHPSQALLSLYATRSLRGVASYATRLLGTDATVLAPGATDAVVRASLGLDPGVKAGGTLYDAVFGLLAPAAAKLPSTADTPRRPPRLPRRWRSRFAVEAHRRSLADGPLAEHLSPELRAWLERGEEVDPTPDLRLGIEGVSMLHAWWRRYRDVLREVDPADLRG